MHSAAVASDGFYGFTEGVWAGVPVKTTEPGSYEVQRNFEMDEFAKKKIEATNAELVSERETVSEMLTR
jgi:malate dehydrogenase